MVEDIVGDIREEVGSRRCLLWRRKISTVALCSGVVATGQFQAASDSNWGG